jgi:phosphoadenosine phosphosulfate reductase
MGDITEDPECQWITAGNVTVFAEGSLISKGPDEKEVRIAMRDMYRLIVRAEECAGCSLCVARCPVSALSLNGGCVVLDTAKCTHCRKCLGRCPAADFREDEEV